MCGCSAAARLPLSCTWSLRCLSAVLLCWLSQFLRTAPCSGAGVRTAWAPPGAEPSFERSTSWTRLSTPPSAATESPPVAPTSASSSSHPPGGRDVSTGSVRCGGRSPRVGDLPAGGQFFGRSSAWTLLSTLPSSVSEPPLSAQTSARSSFCSCRGESRHEKKNTDESVQSLLMT